MKFNEEVFYHYWRNTSMKDAQMLLDILPTIIESEETTTNEKEYLNTYYNHLHESVSQNVWMVEENPSFLESEYEELKYKTGLHSVALMEFAC